MTLVEFLEARLAEDEDGRARHLRDFAEALRGLGFAVADYLDEESVRVLREVAAKRAIVALAKLWDGDPNDYGQARTACEHLAAVYADHPDYDADWAV